MFSVPANAKLVPKISFPVMNIEKNHAINVLKVERHQKKAVPNVLIVHLVNSSIWSKTKKFVPNALLDLHKVKPIKQIVPSVKKEKKHQLLAVVFV